MDKRFEMRMSAEIKELAETVAKSRGVTLAELVRQLLIKEAEKNKKNKL